MALNAVAAERIPTQRTASHLGQRAYQLLGYGTSCRQSCNRTGKEQPIAAQRLLRHSYRLARISQLQPSHAGTAFAWPAEVVAQGDKATVLSIGNGDTIRVRQVGKALTARLACIEAPESA